jgi:hypothetical protein
MWLLRRWTIDVATKSALRVARIHGDDPGGGGEGGAKSRYWRGEEGARRSWWRRVFGGCWFMSENHAGWAREREELFGRVVLWPWSL